MSVEQRIEGLGLTVPDPPAPVASYVPAVHVENMVYTSGQIPFVRGELKYKGKIGGELTREDGYEAAKICTLNCLSVIKGEIGSLDRIERVVRLTGYISSAPGFNYQHEVMNGASDLIGSVFMEKGKHSRVAVGVPELPVDAAVEVEMIVQIK